MAENKTNAMRLLEKGKIPYTVHTYEAAQAVDGVTVAGKIGRPPEQVFKTLVTVSYTHLTLPTTSRV